jgi:hypothetical protein
LLYKEKRTSWRVAIAAAAILIPNADDWFYRYQLAQYCKNEAGYKVYEYVSRNDGLVSQHFLYSENFTQLTPLSYIESSTRKPNEKSEWITTLWRSDRRSDGTASERYAIKAYTADYEVIETKSEYGPLIEKGFKIVRRIDQKLISEYKSMYFMGGWYPRVILPEGLVAACEREGKVMSRKQLKVSKNFDFHGGRHTLYKLINQTFTKD